MSRMLAWLWSCLLGRGSRGRSRGGGCVWYVVRLGLCWVGWCRLGSSLCAVVFVLDAEVAELVAVVILEGRVVPFALGLEE